MTMEVIWRMLKEFISLYKHRQFLVTYESTSSIQQLIGVLCCILPHCLDCLSGIRYIFIITPIIDHVTLRI